MLRVSALLALLVTLLAAPAAQAAQEERWTPVVAGVVAPPEPVEAADGRVHLAYELLLINRSFLPPAKATVRSVQVLAGGKVIASLSGKRLRSVMVPFGDPTSPGDTLAQGEAGFVLMDVSFKRGAKLPQRLTHRLRVATEPANTTAPGSYAAAPGCCRSTAALATASASRSTSSRSRRTGCSAPAR